MKTIHSTIWMLAIAASLPASAANLMLNFRSTSTNAAASGDVTAAYQTLSPAHDDGSIPLAQTTWNNFSSTASSGSLNNADGSAASGVTLTFGSERVANSGSIDYSYVTGINISALYGNGGGTAGQQSLTGNSASIYGNGNNSSNSAAARAGWLGAANSAIGMRMDGLAAGDYRIYVMARNTNSNATTAAPMFLYASTGASSSTFGFSSLTPTTEANTTYPNSNPTAYNAFDEGVNYVVIEVTVAAGQSLFLASDGAATGETRGFLNMVQIVSIPETSVPLLAGLGLLALGRRRR
ncbi:MAG: hypothetical protein J0M04_24260 [Verrucomicrobia bacterium]|nr:hypothetical protein [Verrucomicrobiota bacterium]